MLSSVAYDKETSTLYGKFNTGQVWAYANVSEEVFNGLLKKGSEKIAVEVKRFFSGECVARVSWGTWPIP